MPSNNTNGGWGAGGWGNNGFEDDKNKRGGQATLPRMGNFITKKLKEGGRWVLKDGIGDKMDRGNFWVMPAFTIFIFSIFGLTRIAGDSFDATSCRPASVYPIDEILESAGRNHCITAPRYWAHPKETLPLDDFTKVGRYVQNPVWVHYFWGPILFFLWLLPRLLWSWFVENQGIDFNNSLEMAKSVTVLERPGDNIQWNREDKDRVKKALPSLARYLRAAKSSKAYIGFIAYQTYLLAAHPILVLMVLPWLIGPDFRTFGVDVIKTRWMDREWHDSQLYSVVTGRLIIPPLMPKITYCDFFYDTLGQVTLMIYRCWLDTHSMEWLALVTWAMLLLWCGANYLNLLFWLKWSWEMRDKEMRCHWLKKYWMDAHGCTKEELLKLDDFCEDFSMAQMLLLYYIECHINRSVVRTICAALFGYWLKFGRMAALGDVEQQGGDISNVNAFFRVGLDLARTEQLEMQGQDGGKDKDNPNDIGWRQQQQQVQVQVEDPHQQSVWNAANNATDEEQEQN